LILTLTVVEKVYEEWRLVRATSTVEDFSRGFGNTYEGTRLSDTKWIIRQIKKVEAQLNPELPTKSKKKSISTKQARESSSNIVEEAPAASDSGPESASHADSEFPTYKKAKQSHDIIEALIEEAALNRALSEKPVSSLETTARQNAALIGKPVPLSNAASQKKPAPIESSTSTMKYPAIEKNKAAQPSPIYRRPTEAEKPSSGRRKRAQFIIEGEVTETRSIDENGQTIITYDHSRQCRRKVMSAGWIGNHDDSKDAPKSVSDSDVKKNVLKGPRADDHYRPNHPNPKNVSRNVRHSDPIRDVPWGPRFGDLYRPSREYPPGYQPGYGMSQQWRRR
jgi:hypothetical protein